MKWLVVAGVVLAAVVVIPLVIGALLPAKHVASKSRVLRASPEAVWQVIRDVERAPSWREGVSRVELLPDGDGHARFRETSRFGDMTFEILESDAPRRFVTRIADKDQGFGGTWTYALTPEGGGTRVTLTEEGEVSNPLYRFMSRFLFGYEATLNSYLSSLAKKLGEQ